MPKPVTADSRQAYADWVDENPLRQFRLTQEPKMPLLEMCQRIGVGMSMLQMYERGVHKPGPSRAEAIAALLGDDWADRWDKWIQQRPVA